MTRRAQAVRPETPCHRPIRLVIDRPTRPLDLTPAPLAEDGASVRWALLALALLIVAMGIVGHITG